MADDDLFTLDVVRDFMASQGGKVTNHTLVTHFRTFLNDSRKKVANRQKFKTFVNTLSTVKLDPSGEKVLVLKKKYRDITVPVEECVDTPARTKPPGSAKKRKKEDSQTKPKDEDDSEQMEAAAAGAAAAEKPPTPEPEGDPEECTHVPEPEPEPSEGAEAPDFEASLPQESPLEETGSSIAFSTISSEPSQESVASIPESESSSSLKPEPIPEEEEEGDVTDGKVVESVPVPAPPVPEPQAEEQQRKGSVSSEGSRKGSVSSGSVSSEKIAEDLTSPPASEPPKEFVTPETKPVEEGKMEAEAAEPVGKVPMSVKARAQHLNKMQSESDILNSTIGGKPATKQSPEKRGDDDDSQSGMAISLDATEREWLVTASKAEYHSLTKLLRENPHLAKRKDFTSTALHWAAKHGNTDVVKLLCGNHEVQVNSRSGYTPLHLAAMHGHEQILEILIHTYGADPNMRDYSGKKAKQYLSISASTRAHQLLQARRSSSSSSSYSSHGQIQNTGIIHVPFRRHGSYSNKIRNVGHFGISAGSAVRSSWAQGSVEDGSRSRSATPSPSPSPKLSPRESPFLSRKGSMPLPVGEADLMPPPSSAPPRRKRSSRKISEKENVSDSELSRASSEPDLELQQRSHSTDIQLNTLV